VAVGVALLGLAVPGVAGQVAALILAGFVGWWHVPLRPIQAGVAPRWPVSRKLGVAAFVLFVVLLIGLPIWAAATGSSAASLVEAVYRAGALVFGGGHVVLPLLQAGVVPGGFVTGAEFLAGYGAAQAVPGPLFTFAAYIGAVAEGPMTGWWGGMVLLLVIFVPGALVLIAALPFWEALRHRPGVQRIMAGVNAGVVVLLLAAGFWRSAAVLARALCRHLRSSWSPCVFLETLSSPLHLFRVSRHASNPSPIAQAFGRTLIRRGAPDGYVGGFAQGGRR